MRIVLLPALALAVAACGDPAEFRPAKGVADLPSVKAAYRVQEMPDPACDKIGFVREADTIEDIAETTASHGGTHFKVLDDRVSTTLETHGTSAPLAGGLQVHNATTDVVKHHKYVAEAYRCAK